MSDDAPAQGPFRRRGGLTKLVLAAQHACCVGDGLGLERLPAIKQFVPIFRALGDETRLEIVALLASARRELCACDIEKRFDLSQPTISHHLRVLREAGLVTGEKRGLWVHYALSTRAFAALGELLGMLDQ